MIPEIIRQFGGVTYTLRSSARTMIAIEHEFECKIGELPEIVGAHPDVRTTARLARLCIRKDGKMLTDAEFEDLLDHVSIEELGKILTDAMQAASPKKRGGDGGN